MLRNRVVLDDLSKHLEALGILSCLKLAYAGFQQRQRPLILVPVFLRVNRLEMNLGLGMIRQHSKVVFTQLHMRIKTNLAARIPLNNRAPQLQPLVGLAGFDSKIPRFHQPSGGAILNNRSTRQAWLAFPRFFIRFAKHSAIGQRQTKHSKEQAFDAKTPPNGAALT